MFSTRASLSVISGHWAPPAPPTHRYGIRAAFRSLWWMGAGSRARRETGNRCTIAAASSSSSWPSPTSSSSSTSFSSSLPEGCVLVDAAEARAIGGTVVSLNSLVLIREEDEDDAESKLGVEDEPDDADSEQEVAVAVLRASDALDLSAAARQLGWPGARLAPRSEVPRLLRHRFAPGGIPPLGHEGLRTLVCSRAFEEEEEREGEEEEEEQQQRPRETSFVAGGGDPALRLVFRGRGALAAAMEAEGAAVVPGLGVGRPPLVLPFSPGAEAAAASRDSDSDAASSPAPTVYSSPPPLFADDAEGFRALAEVLLPPAAASPSPSAPSPSPSSSNRQRWHFLGIDAEWVPERDRGASGRHPVETLQLATRDAAAVLDVAALSLSREGSEALVGLLVRAATAGTGVGGAEKSGGGGSGGGGGDDNSVRVLFVGHSARQDLVRLARTIAEASAARGEGRREGETGGGESGSDSGSDGSDGNDGETPAPPLLPLLTLPNLPVHAVDLPALAKWAVSPPGALVPAGRLPGGHGLANLVKTFLGDGNTTLSKELQRSDWGARPLTPQQLAYAAADAHACVAVAERILTELRPELAATRKRAAAHSGGLTELDGGFSRGSGRKGLLARGNKKGSYLLSPPPPLAPGPARDARRAAREERRAAAMLMAAGEEGGGGGSLFSSSSSNLERTRRMRRGGSGGGGDGAPFPPPPVSSGGSAADADADVEGLLRDFLGLPLPGKGGRGLAVAAALGLLSPGGGAKNDDDNCGGDGGGDGPSWRRGRGRGRARSDADEPSSSRSHLVVPRFDRGGVARLRNACVLFVNLDAGGGGGASRYPNEFVKGDAPGELRLTWFPSPGQGASHPLVRRLLSPNIAGGERHSVLLFCRLRSAKSGLGGGKADNGPYYFLGRLGEPRVDWGDNGEGFGEGEEEDEEDEEEAAVLSRASSRSSSSRQYPAIFAWKLLDAEMAAARGGRDVEALFEAGAPRKRSTTAAAG